LEQEEQPFHHPRMGATLKIRPKSTLLPSKSHQK
jgi:hypothetical protein